MSYTVLARKYRSQTFADLVGQEHVSRTLGNAIKSGRVAHAFLFTGARGVGKTSTARLLAKALNCEQGPTPEPCNVCDPCREITNGVDTDVLEIDGASNNSVDDVRRLQESLPYRPSRDRFKIVIVDEVHMLSTGAFNAFLKTLEEPPAHVKFIFATTEIHKVPITIRSRCQRHDFRLIPHALVSQHVRRILAQENITADDEAIALVVREAGGSLRDALTVLEQLLAFGGGSADARGQGPGELRGAEVARGLGIADQASVLSTAQAVLDGDAAACVRAIAALGDQGLDVMHFARELLWLLRDLVVLRVVGDDERLVDRPAEERASLQQVANAHAAPQLERTFAGLSKLLDEAAESANPQLALEMGLVRLADRPPLQPLATLVERLQALEARLGGPGPGGGGGGRDRSPQRTAAARELREPVASSGPQFPPVKPSAGPSPNPSPSPIPSPNRSPNPNPSPSPSPNLSPNPSPIPSPSPSPNRSPNPVPNPSPIQTASPAPTTPAAPDSGHSDLPTAWLDIIGSIRASQPALGAVLEHGVPVQVDATSVKISFPEGSFFGKQAASKQARDALAEAAARVLGGSPTIEVGYNLQSGRTTVAAEQAAQKKQRRSEVEQTARSHPRVREAMDVFEEQDVQVEVE